MRIAIVPARGGSSRIPRKNLRNFLGKPIIAYPVATLIESQLFDRIVVSTDDEAIARLSEDLGALVPFRRPAELSDEHASTDAVLLHALDACEALWGSIEIGCCVYASTPFVTAPDLRHGLNLLQTHNATSCFPVVKYEFPIQQAFVLDGNQPRPVSPESLDMRSQDLQDHYHDAGMFYWFDVEKFKAGRKLFAADSVAFPVSPDRCHDINTPEDWNVAELKYRAASLPRE